MSKHTVTITDNKTGKVIELPVRQSTLGPEAVDIGRFFRESGISRMTQASCPLPVARAH
jgi:hypothetical protein